MEAALKRIQKSRSNREDKNSKTARDVRSFLGTAGWYRRFIKDFAILLAPLTDTLKKGKKCELSSEAIESFETLKISLTTAPVLWHADLDKTFLSNVMRRMLV